jgi:hypothetical protein
MEKSNIELSADQAEFFRIKSQRVTASGVYPYPKEQETVSSGINTMGMRYTDYISASYPENTYLTPVITTPVITTPYHVVFSIAIPDNSYENTQSAVVFATGPEEAAETWYNTLDGLDAADMIDEEAFVSVTPLRNTHWENPRPYILYNSAQRYNNVHFMRFEKDAMGRHRFIITSTYDGIYPE